MVEFQRCFRLLELIYPETKQIMNDDYYDSKGISHRSQFGAEQANRTYLQEEETAREKLFEMQKQQADAAERGAIATEQLQREQAEAEERHLSELKKQGRLAQQDRDYEKQVLFLKESDEGTRVDTFVEILVSKLDWQRCTQNDRGCATDEWVGEHNKTLSLFYQQPELPKECQANGTLTRKILTLAESSPKSADAFLPDEALQLKTESDEFDRELHQLDAEIGVLTVSPLDWSSLGCSSLGCQIMGGIALSAFIAFVYGLVFGVYSVLVIGSVLGASAVIQRQPSFLRFKEAFLRVQQEQLRAKEEQLRAKNEQKSSIAKQKDLLQQKLQPFWDKAQAQVRKETNAAARSAEQWITTYRNVLIKSFFDQRLWIEDGFPGRLKEVFKDIQKPFPTSCRADVSKLSKSQIEFVYSVLTKNVTEEITLKLTRCEDLDGAFFQSLVPHRPILQAGGDFDDLDKYEANQSKTQVLVEKKVLVSFEYDMEISKRHKALIYEVLMAGPSALNTHSLPPSEESPEREDASVKLPPTMEELRNREQNALFVVMLVRIPADKEIAVFEMLREVKPGLEVAEALKLIEHLPSKVLDGVPENVARAAKENLERAGAGVRLDTMNFV